MSAETMQQIDAELARQPGETAEMDFRQLRQLAWKVYQTRQDHARFLGFVTELYHRLVDGEEHVHGRDAVSLLSYMETAAFQTGRVRAVLDALRGGRAAVDADDAALLAAVETRTAKRTRLDAGLQGHANLISIGVNCAPWLILNRWGLRTPEEFVSLYTPFCLAVHRLPALVTTIAAGFRDYCNPADIAQVETPNGHSLATRKDRGVVWNHNKGLHWAADDYAGLRANLDEKIANFRIASRQPNPVYVMSACPARHPEFIADSLPPLRQGLAAFAGTDRFFLHVSNCQVSQPREIIRIDDRCTFAYLPYPERGYSFQDDSKRNSEVGIGYEEGYVAAMIEQLVAWGLLRRTDDAA